MTDLNPNDIHLNDLPDECRQIAEVIGLAAFIDLVRAWGGESIYVPKLESVAAACRNRAIRSEFNGRNYRELAKKYGLTVRWVRAIVSDGTGRSCDCRTVDTQLQMF